MIPKIIHYCWFGGKEMPPLVQKCIKSWKEHLPDYEFKLWNEENFDKIVANGAKELMKTRNMLLLQTMYA